MVTHQDGRITFFHLFTIVVIIVVGINAMKFVVPWIDNYRLKGRMQESINQAKLLTDQDMIKSVVDKAKELRIKLAPENIEVTRINGGGTRLRAEYEVTIETWPVRFYRDLSFRPDVVKGR